MEPVSKDNRKIKVILVKLPPETVELPPSKDPMALQSSILSGDYFADTAHQPRFGG
ncbi:MAG: hypothetical protein Q7S10_00975 [bacterium]|nr:hypothetical protein [bacterium]